MQEIQRRSAVDGAFRSALQSDPKGTLAAEGIHVPEGVTVKVIEAAYNRLPIVLPPVLKGELSDEALMSMVGGSATSPADFIARFLNS